MGRLENSINQTVRGWIVRASHTLDTGAFGDRRHRPRSPCRAGGGGVLLPPRGRRWGLLVVALTGLLVSPISWSHHWVWCVPLLALAWYEARALLIPTLLVFWSHVVWLVPHGDHVELDLGRGEIAMSGWYVVYAAGVRGRRSRRGPAATPRIGWFCRNAVRTASRCETRPREGQTWERR